MKKYVLFVGVLGVFSLFAACTVKDKGLDPLDDDGEATVESSDSSGGKSSTEKAKSSSSTKASSSSAKGSSSPKDTTHQQVFVSDSEVVEYSYPSSGIFCWDENCDARLNSSSSAASSSSEKIVIEMSSESSEPPEVNGDRMTDKRDGKSYKLQNVAGKLWMAENLRYETSNGAFCSTEGGEDHCAKYGQFYTYAAAQRVCPGGWRLPTEAEVKAADAEVPHEWWSVGGRFKVADGKATEYGLEDEQGYIWTQANGELNSWRVKNYNGDNEHAMQSSEGAERAYNVRCVQE